MSDTADTNQPRLVRINGQGTWFVYHNRARRSTGTASRPEAEIFLRDYVAELARPPADERVTVERLLAAYLQNRIKRQKPGADRLRYCHAALSGFFGGWEIADIDGDACIDYRTHRETHGIAPRTVRTELESLRAALHWGQTAEGGRVVTEMPDLELPPKGHARERYLTTEEAQRLLDACKPRHLKLFVALGLYTAARRGAILSLTWDRVDFENRRIDYRTPNEIVTKKRKVPVPMAEALFAIMSAAHAKADSPFVIERAGDRIASIRHGFTTAVQGAGLVGVVTPHTLRHTAVTWMLQRRVTIWDAAGFAGMTAEMVQKTYGHHVPDYGADAAAALDQALRANIATSAHDRQSEPTLSDR